MTTSYPIPAGRHRIETVERRSRFLATADRTASVDEARAFIAEMRTEMPDASHHVYAFRVGYGPTETSGMSDDGEPSGTAGRPVLAVVAGSHLGDVCVVVTRYFGGTKLGTGGLVRAYTAAAQQVLAELPCSIRQERRRVALRLPYALYDGVLRMAEAHGADVADAQFAADVSLQLDLPEEAIEPFAAAVAEATSGQVTVRSVPKR